MDLSLQCRVDVHLLQYQHDAYEGKLDSVVFGSVQWSCTICDVFCPCHRPGFYEVRLLVAFSKIDSNHELCFSSVYALSVDHNWLGGYLWVLAVVGIALGGVYQSTTIARVNRQ